MARPPRETIDDFVAVTGASEALALQKLEEYHGDLNEAVNAYLNEQESAESRAPFQQVYGSYDFEDVPYGDSPIARWPEPFSFLRQSFQSIFGGDGLMGSKRNVPGVSHPRNVREIPIEFKDEGNFSGVPRIEDVTGRVTDYHPTIQGNVTCDDVEDVPDSRVGMNERTSGGYNLDYAAPSAPRIDFISDKETEDDLMKAVIEASKREAMPHKRSEHKSEEDIELEHAISLSLKDAQERARLEQGKEIRRTGSYSSERVAFERSDEVDAEHLKEHDRRYQQTLGSPTFAYDGGNPVNSIPSSSAIRDNRYYHIGDEPLDEDDEYFAELAVDKEKLNAVKEVEQDQLVEVSGMKAGHQRMLENEKMERQHPPEPSLDDDNAIVLLVKMPDGSRHGRRFLKSDKLQFLVDFIDMGGFDQHRSYRLVRQFPRRVFGEAELEMTFSELGLTEKQEVLFLELI